MNGMLAAKWISNTIMTPDLASVSMSMGVTFAGRVNGSPGCPGTHCLGVGARGNAAPGSKTAQGHWAGHGMGPRPTCHWQLSNADGLPVELLDFSIDD